MYKMALTLHSADNETLYTIYTETFSVLLQYTRVYNIPHTQSPARPLMGGTKLPGIQMWWGRPTS